jgi:predicted alpha/beta superfamily hydrolase
MKKILLYALCSLICSTAISQNIMKVEQHSFKSTTYKETRSFRIAVPASAYPNVKYNILFVLDADYAFDLIASTAIYLQTFEYIPPTAVVAVDYSTPGNRNDVGYDLSNNSLDSSGELFYNYINTDLAREISKILPTSGFNTLVGHSYTASYLNYYIDAGNDYIKSYILFSPEEMRQLPRFEANYKTNVPSIRIITAENDTDGRKSFGQNLYKTFHEKHYDVKLKTIKADHMSIIPVGIMEALTGLYDKYYNIDSIYNIIEQTDISLWEIFSSINESNKNLYNQALPISGSYISAFLWTAIQKDEKESIDKLRVYYKNALTNEESDPNALGVMGDLMNKLGRWEEADYFLDRCLTRYKKLKQEHETLYWRRVYALNVLPKLGQYKKAWKLLEEGKKIYPDDKAIFSYYQGVLSIENNYLIKQGIEQMRFAISNPVILKNNFVDPEKAGELLKKGISILGNIKQ